ncbi:hypothetical protein B0H03_101326 [Rathayibacter iranicus NCPPB 2253 = VKM Ac-1602]|uniref:Uncharacterized protein n=1 Tax=Rathayibacter iranicus NCPPB 2253 = VKM Ac-1602 TaxID=1328868 RepID=A0ABX5LGI1_9MICO|nr:hypothetical protein B0H03_101326 [Rathayibacter iranicus NCPPB 2253 = VKM Ac-1602]
MTSESSEPIKARRHCGAITRIDVESKPLQFCSGGHRVIGYRCGELTLAPPEAALVKRSARAIKNVDTELDHHHLEHVLQTWPKPMATSWEVHVAKSRRVTFRSALLVYFSATSGTCSRERVGHVLSLGMHVIVRRGNVATAFSEIVDCEEWPGRAHNVHFERRALYRDEVAHRTQHQPILDDEAERLSVVDVQTKPKFLGRLNCDCDTATARSNHAAL